MASILIVDDELPIRTLLEAMLEQEGHVTVSVGSGEDALAQVARQPPDLILLDLMMPGMSGCDVAKILKAHGATANIPLVMVSARADGAARMAALEAGAESFLMKPLDQDDLCLRVRNLLRLKAYGDSERQAAEQRLHHLAHYDPLTGLPNRTLFCETLTKVVGLASEAGWTVAVLFVDLDRFKEVNDTHGHMTGDRVLEVFGDSVRDMLRNGDLVGRPGGEEFAVAMPGASAGTAYVVAERIRIAFSERCRRLGTPRLNPTVSAGVSTAHPRSTLDTMFASADRALYRAKQLGRDRIEMDDRRRPAELQDAEPPVAMQVA
jgi:diguanylate cyclase (GGDEF)-like protein